MKLKYYKARPAKHPFPIVAWLIMLFQGEMPWNKKSSSHRALGYDIYENEYVVDSTGGYGVLDQCMGEFLEKYKITETIEFEMDIELGPFVEWVASQKGKKYDRLQVTGLALRLLGLISFNKMGWNYKRLTCNELILHFADTFTAVPVQDPDNWDMLLTDELIEEIKAGKYVASMD